MGLGTAAVAQGNGGWSHREAVVYGLLCASLFVAMEWFVLALDRSNEPLVSWIGLARPTVEPIRATQVWIGEQASRARLGSSEPELAHES
ncbi:hypothetical protein GUJ93_ZPchr0004g40448 [Zizania palustris]|uniref:Uncharacterized protein n=1 Tax=Zizania palustris TaxID=103762 RepID=A0A8J5SF18_ZIZPA|nr:hypothetical protein GUJ93_ZPchr0004g40448 [Zizania palustris]